jgi:hypothetical protein
LNVDNETIVGPGIAPFVKYTSAPGATGLFVEGTVLFQALMEERSGSSLYGGGFDFGVETFVKESWSLRLGPSYRLLQSTESSSKPVHAFGVSWALSAYF